MLRCSATKSHGYKIKVIEGYNFNRESHVFKGFVNNVYKIKSNPNHATQKAMAKSLLNNLLGRFGIDIEKPKSEIMTSDAFNKLQTMHKITSFKQISDSRVLVTYIPSLDYEIIKSHDLDFIKILSKQRDKETPSIIKKRD